LFHRSLALLRLRQQRYRPDAGTIEARSPRIERGTRFGRCRRPLPDDVLARIRATLGSGAIEEADRELQGVLKDTVRLGDAERNLLCLVYLSVAARQLGDADSAEAVCKCGNRTGAHEWFPAVTRPWRAVRSPGSRGVARRGVGRSFSRLAQHSMIPNFPFAWMYAAVAVAIAVERGDIDNAKGMVADMLEPTHQRLDDNVQAVFEQALAEPSLTTLQSVVETCRRVRYL
jgi:hypothetical protein